MSKSLHISHYGLLLCGFPGVGKTTLMDKCADEKNAESDLLKNLHIFDSDSSNFDKSKFPVNYLMAVAHRAPTSEKVVQLLSTHQAFLDLLMQQEIQHIVAVPSMDDETKEIYRQRYLNRPEGFNGGEKFANLIMTNWENWLRPFYNEDGTPKSDNVRTVWSLKGDEFLYDRFVSEIVGTTFYQHYAFARM